VFDPSFDSTLEMWFFTDVTKFTNSGTTPLKIDRLRIKRRYGLAFEYSNDQVRRAFIVQLRRETLRVVPSDAIGARASRPQRAGVPPDR